MAVAEGAQADLGAEAVAGHAGAVEVGPVGEDGGGDFDEAHAVVEDDADEVADGLGEFVGEVGAGEALLVFVVGFSGFLGQVAAGFGGAAEGAVGAVVDPGGVALVDVVEEAPEGGLAEVGGGFGTDGGGSHAMSLMGLMILNPNWLGLVRVNWILNIWAIKSPTTSVVGQPV